MNTPSALPVPSRPLKVALFHGDDPPALNLLAQLAPLGVQFLAYSPEADCLVRHSKYIQQFELCPEPTAFDQFLPWLEAKLKAGVFDVVAPTSDFIAYTVARLRDSFAEDIRATLPTVETLLTALDKGRLHHAMQAAGIRCPNTALPESTEAALSAAERMGYPVLLKPRTHLGLGWAWRGGLFNDAASLKAAFVRTPHAPGNDQFAQQHPEFYWPMVQAFQKQEPSLDTRVYSVTGFMNAQGQAQAVGVVRKLACWPPLTGVGTVFEDVDAPVLAAHGTCVAQVLQLRGIFELEFLDSPQGWALLDVNPRAFGMISLDLACGRDLAGHWWAAASGDTRLLEVRPLAVPPVPIRWRNTVPVHITAWVAFLRCSNRWDLIKRYYQALRRPAVGRLPNHAEPSLRWGLFLRQLNRLPTLVKHCIKADRIALSESIQ